MLHIITDYIYEHYPRGRLAMCEGESIHSWVGISLLECQKHCEKNKTCLSFSFCGNDKGICNLKNKVLDRFDQKVYSGNCTSYYKKCDGKCFPPLFYLLY